MNPAAWLLQPTPLATLQSVPTPESLISMYPSLTKIVFAIALGILLGTEREWSEKPAGIRTFTIITLAATVATLVGEPALLVLGGALVVIQGSVFAIKGAVRDDESFMLTTSVSMFLAYGVGALVGLGQYIEAVLITVVTSMLLVLRRELHEFARNRSKNEIRSAIEFVIIAFLIFPLLPENTYGPGGVINVRSLWLLVVAVSAIGFANYLIVQRYGAKGLAITSFFGGLVNSAAVVGAIVSRTRDDPNLGSIAVGGVLLANAAMAVRDLLITVLFIPGIIGELVVPLGAMTVTGIGLSHVISDWDVEFELEFDSPFNLSTALKFGALFLVFLFVSALARETFGTSGFLISSFLGGFVSSGAVTTSVVLLVQSGQLTEVVAVIGVVAAVSASILMKLGLVLFLNRSIALPVAWATLALIGSGAVAGTASMVLLP